MPNNDWEDFSIPTESTNEGDSVQPERQPTQKEVGEFWKELFAEHRTYFYIGRKLKIESDWADSPYSLKEYCESGNYFSTEAEAQATLDLIKPFFTPLGDKE